MQKHRLTRLIRLALAAAFTLAFADRAAASSILLSNLDIQFDETGLIASITAGLEAQSGDGSDVYLDSLAVSLFQDGEAIPDLFFGPTQLDAEPFFALPFTLADGGILPDSTLLFRLTGLIAGATYTGSFALSQFGQDDPLVSQEFEFTANAPVPEPSTLVLTGFGMAALLRKRLAKRGAKSLIANP
jgi:PEP-CTERM motif